MSLNNPQSSVHSGPPTSEFDILKNSHKFLRGDDNVDDLRLPWDDRLAKKYYSSLYREYAVCDLKHYKSGNFALRWRTEEEVLSGAGETICGNTRCPLHNNIPNSGDGIVQPRLTVLELPFSYDEHGESKFALVKVVLCTKCCKKLMWKRNKEKAKFIKQEKEECKVDISHEEADRRFGVQDSSERRRKRSHSLGDAERPSGSVYRKRSIADDSGRERNRMCSSRSRSPPDQKEISRSRRRS